MGLNCGVEDIEGIAAIPTLRECRACDTLEDADSIEMTFRNLMKNQGAAAEAVGSLRGLFGQLREHICSQLVGREEVVDCVLAGLISEVPVAIFGPPGTAKSACVRLIAQACTSPKKNSDQEQDGGRADDNQGLAGDPTETIEYFEWLVTNHTMPEELFGPPRIDKLEDGVFERNTRGKLPEAEFVFLDEVFRGGGHILNTLLTVINERKFHNGSKPIDVPMIGLVAAANDPPSSPDVKAFYDRFPIRVWIDSVLDDVQPKKVNERGAALLNSSADFEGMGASGSKGTQWLVSTNHFRMARSVLSIGPASTDYQIQRQREDGTTPRFQEFMKLFDAMRLGFGISDRSLWRLYRFGCALDWLRGEDMNESLGERSASGHLDVFKYVAESESLGRDARGRVEEFSRSTKLQGSS